MTELKEQFLHFWNKISKQQKIFLGAGLIAVFVAVLGWSYWFGARAEYVPLYTRLETKDAADIVSKLKENKVNYEVADNGASILVPQKSVYQVRMDLASQGLPKGKKGFEIFEETKFGTTEFQNKVNYLQALQGELARTIEQIQEIESARVHIVMPEDSIYKKNEKPASASVMLQLQPNSTINRKQITGIVNLVSHSVQGLKPDNITIIDGFAKILNLPEVEETKKEVLTEKDSNAEASKMSKFYFELTREIQTDIQGNVQTLLDNSLGEKKAVARVTVELNFDRRLIDRQIFEPTLEDRGILRSAQDVTETYQGTNAQPGGPPGTTSNIPGYPAGQQGQSNYEKKESTKNYEISEIKEKIIQQPVAIKRVTVAVFIDETLNQVQQDGISRVVASAAGFNEARGDLVSVERVPFSATTQTNVQVQQQQDILRYGIPVLILLLAGIAWFIYSRRKKQQLAQQQAQQEQEQQEQERLAAAQEQERLALLQAQADELSQDEQEEIETEEEELRLSMDRELTQAEKEVAAKQAVIEEWAEKQPDDFTLTLRTWLNDE